MFLNKKQWPILITLTCFMIFFGAVFSHKRNYEFLVYIAVIVFFAILILVSKNKIKYPNYLLWLLTSWAILHMSGGLVYINGTRLYDLIIIPLSRVYPIIRYDHIVHIFGFFTATIVIYVLLKPYLKSNIKRWTALSIVIIMAGFGLGALNEVIEFLATVFIDNTGVGGYLNISLDLISNLVGAILGFIFIRLKEE